MPATLSHLSRNNAVLTHKFDDGESITITYRPGRVTPRQLHRANALGARPFDELTPDEQNELADDTTRLLASLIVNWDMLDDDGQPIEPTMDGLQDVDYEAQSVILSWIVEDIQLGKANGTALSQESSTPASASREPVPMTRTSRPAQTGTTSTKQRSG